MGRLWAFPGLTANDHVGWLSAGPFGSSKVKAVLHQQVDVAEVDVSEVDRDLMSASRNEPLRPSNRDGRRAAARPQTFTITVIRRSLASAPNRTFRQAHLVTEMGGTPGR